MYRTICCELWTDDKVQSLSPHEKLLFLYLITNPHSHLSGLYYLPTILIEHEVGLGRAFDGAWKGLLKSPMAAYDAARSQVWVVNMLKYQGRGQKTDKGIASHLNTLHASPLVERFLSVYPHIIPHLPSEFVRCPIDAPSIPHGTFPSPVPDSSPNSEEGKKSEEGEFQQFWDTYPKKIGKRAAEKAWYAAKSRPALNLILSTLHTAKASPDWKKEQGKYIPHPATWLNQGRWDDVLTMPSTRGVM